MKMVDDGDRIQSLDLAKMPHLRQIFQAFLRGRHISNEDFNLYHELQDGESRYEALFEALGYTLVGDRRGFYYLVPDDSERTMNATTRKMALLVFILVDVLADTGRDPLHAITREAIDLGAMTELMCERHRDLLEEGGFPDPEAVGKYFATVFCRLGFATLQGDVLRFQPPILRFLDVCQEVGRRPEASLNQPEALAQNLESRRQIDLPAAGGNAGGDDDLDGESPETD